MADLRTALFWTLYALRPITAVAVAPGAGVAVDMEANGASLGFTTVLKRLGVKKRFRRWVTTVPLLVWCDERNNLIAFLLGARFAAGVIVAYQNR